MEREIKFRGLDMNNNWVYGSLVNTTRGLLHRPKQQTKTWIITSAFGNGGWFNVEGRQYVYSETVSQFTGLQDKNGTDIYEGDIVKIENVITADNSFGLSPNGYVVEYVEFAIYFNNELGRWDIDVDTDDIKYKMHLRNVFLEGNVTVIGNIHEED